MRRLLTGFVIVTYQRARGEILDAVEGSEDRIERRVDLVVGHPVTPLLEYRGVTLADGQRIADVVPRRRDDLPADLRGGQSTLARLCPSDGDGRVRGEVHHQLLVDLVEDPTARCVRDRDLTDDRVTGEHRCDEQRADRRVLRWGPAGRGLHAQVVY